MSALAEDLPVLVRVTNVRMTGAAAVANGAIARSTECSYKKSDQARVASRSVSLVTCRFNSRLFDVS